MEFVDALRGVAVVAMILWHTADGWLRPDVRAGAGWESLRYLGGMAAPLFVLLAGVGVGLWAEGERLRVGRAPTRAIVCRGLTVALFGYALRLALWLVDGQAIRHVGFAWGWVPLAAGLAAAVVGLRRLAAGAPAARWLASAAPLVAVGLFVTHLMAPHAVRSILRVDVLQCIGASIALVALAGHALGALRRPAVAVSLALLVAASTPLVAAVVPGPLPDALAGYLGAWPPADGARPATLFPLAPWLAYALVGAAVGVGQRRAAGAGSLTGATVALTLGGAAVAIVTSESLRPTFLILQAVPDLAPVVRVAHRVGVALVLGGAVYGAVAAAPRALRPLGDLGRASLTIYCVHLTFAFGWGSQPVRRELSFGAWAICFAALAIAMVGIARARAGPVSRVLAGASTVWRTRPQQTP